MPNIILALLRRQSRFPGKRWLVLFILTIGLATGWRCAQASTSQNAPIEVKNLLTQIDAAANRGDIKAVLGFYSPNFKHGDGLNRQNMEQALTSLWKRYPKLKYTTQLQSWKAQGNTTVIDTVTKITGVPSANNGNTNFNATIKSRQQITGAKIVRQDILTERTEISSGKVPQLDFQLPQQVKTGQQYSLDAIVQEPLGDDFLLGAALEEPIQPSKYLNPTPVNLELLSSGGLFKVGRAPNNPGSQWISAVIMRGDGMIMITQRMQVVKK
ncbi:hypothetical protein [Calothrix sp. 336/3]|uniref:hypothetical protein n=1 Tax=Calothrix sp. 336/3 TaxID=1337936 RepID=UPI0004E2923D|nr:hypothetical protein [Calothrix sp. 336/3]AKG22627.1 hypothetical protein IJ00_16320 [Calothrix sp. 336/3]